VNLIRGQEETDGDVLASEHCPPDGGEHLLLRLKEGWRRWSGWSIRSAASSFMPVTASMPCSLGWRA
jgi:hypothetical protein